MDISKEVERIMASREAFDAFVYTPFEEMLAEMPLRQKNAALSAYVEKSLPAGLPHIIKEGKHAFLSRDVGTPNYETLRFISAIDAMEDFVPIIWEYGQDKFTPNQNELKYALGKMTFYQGQGKKGGEKTIKQSTVNFNENEGKKLVDVKTEWGQSLIDFHHELFTPIRKSLKHDLIFFDASEWYSKSGGVVEKYYKNIFTMFLTHGVLFENFMVEHESEVAFIRSVFLPAFIEIYRETGVKPLIVPLSPTDIESDLFWSYYPPQLADYVKGKSKIQ